MSSEVLNRAANVHENVLRLVLHCDWVKVVVETLCRLSLCIDHVFYIALELITFNARQELINHESYAHLVSFPKVVLIMVNVTV